MAPRPPVIKPAITKPSAPTPRRRLPQLSSLPASSHRLAVSSCSFSAPSSPTNPSICQFRSIGFNAPAHLFHPPHGSVQASHSCPLFLLRAFRLLPRSSPRALPRPLPPDSLKHLPTPPPALVHLLPPTDWDGTEEEWAQRAKRDKKAYGVNLTVITSKAKISKKATVRNEVRRRIRDAVRVLVMRGAVVQDGELRCDKAREGPRKWLVPGFSYMVHPTLDVYRAPFPQLVDEVGNALRTVKERIEAKQLEQEWATLTASLPDSPPSEPTPPKTE